MTRAAIKHGEEQLRLAMLASDVEVLDLLIDDALLFCDPSGELVRKDDDLENHRSGRQKLTNLVTRDLQIELFGDDVGVVSGIAELAGTFDGAAIGGTFRVLRTWRREHDGQWRIVAGAIFKRS